VVVGGDYSTRVAALVPGEHESQDEDQAEVTESDARQNHGVAFCDAPAHPAPGRSVDSRLKLVIRPDRTAPGAAQA
jgi:hypothetical protein